MGETGIADRTGLLTGQLGNPLIGKAEFLEAHPFFRGVRQTIGLQTGFGTDDVFDLMQEPRVIMGDLVNFLNGHTEAHGLGDAQQTVRHRGAERGTDGGVAWLGLAVIEFKGGFVEAGQAGFHGAQRFLVTLGEGTADGHDLTH